MRVDYAKLASAIEGWLCERISGAGMEGVVLGLSGGIDSAVTAVLAARAMGPDAVLGLVMPCGSSEEDTRDGIRTAEFTGARYRVIDLSGVLESFIEAGNLDRDDALTLANVKARLRMAMLYAHSSGRLVLGTSNYSEYLVGYWTKWGDGAADLHPIARLYKDEVRALAVTMGLPEWVLRRVPSAGLWPGQSDESEMGFTYEDIRTFFEEGDPGDPARERISRMARTSRHKREGIPFFDARIWMEEHEG